MRRRRKRQNDESTDGALLCPSYQLSLTRLTPSLREARHFTEGRLQVFLHRYRLTGIISPVREYL
jgi:hypothetical protein